MVRLCVRISLQGAHQADQGEAGITGVSTSTMSWRSKKSQPAAQIGLLISRRDSVINLCEIKYLKHPYELDATAAADLERKKSVFLTETGAKDAIHATMITAYGLAQSGYRSIVQSEVTMNDLFHQ